MMMIACGFVVWYLDSLAARLFAYQPLLNYAPWFFMGTAAYGLYRFVTPKLSPVLYGVCLVVVMAVPCVNQRLMADDYRTGLISWASGIAFVLALPSFTEIKSASVKRCTHAIATYSYGIYLSHVPILWLAFHKLSGISWLVQVSAFLVLMVTVPVILYHGLEKPMIQLGSRTSDVLAQERSPQAVSAFS